MLQVLDKHVRSVHDRQKYPCPHPGCNLYTSESNRDFHYRYVHLGVTYPCFTFSMLSRIQFHTEVYEHGLRIHGSIPCNWADCDSKFFSLDKHKNHIIQHQAAKRAEDEAKARVAYGLYKKGKETERAQMAILSNRQPGTCLYHDCGKEFAAMESLKLHYLSQHPDIGACRYPLCA